MTQPSERETGTPRLWMICWRYPVFSETIVATEFAEMLEQGVDGVLIPVLPIDPQGETFGIADERIARPSKWPASRAAQLGLLLRAFARRPLRTLRMFGRAWDFRGDDARGALSSTLSILDAGIGSTPEHVHAHFAGHLAHVASLLAIYHGCPWSVSAHAKDIYMKPERLAADFRDASFVRTISSHGQAWIHEHCPGFTRERAPLFFCGVDVNRLRPSAQTASEPFALRVVSVGRFVPKKGHDILVRACAGLLRQGHQVDCTIIGTGPERDRLLALILEHDAGSMIRLAEGLSRDELMARVDRCDVMVLACRVAEDGDRDGIPLALMEAMALGKPVICGHVGGIGDLLAGTDCLLEDVTPTSLGEAILRLALVSAEERRARGQACRRIIEERFALSRNVRQIVEQMKAAAPRGRSEVAARGERANAVR